MAQRLSVSDLSPPLRARDQGNRRPVNRLDVRPTAYRPDRRWRSVPPAGRSLSLLGQWWPERSQGSPVSQDYRSTMQALFLVRFALGPAWRAACRTKPEADPSLQRQRGG